MASDKSSGLNSVNITCQIIEELLKNEEAGVTELAAKTGYAKSTIHRHLSTLEKNEYVVNEEGSYQLGLRFLGIGECLKKKIVNYPVIRDEVQSLAEETGEVAQYAVEEHEHAVYLYKSKGGKGVETASTIGSRAHLHTTALGKAIMSEMTHEQVDEMIDRHGLPQKTENTITERTELLEALKQAKERGYAIDNEENVPGLRCIAAPVVDDDRILGAVSVSGPSKRINGDRFHESLPKQVSRSANVLELNSKFS